MDEEWWKINVEAQKKVIAKLENQNRMLLRILADREKLKIDVSLRCDFACSKCNQKILNFQK